VARIWRSTSQRDPADTRRRGRRRGSCPGGPAGPLLSTASAISRYR